MTLASFTRWQAAPIHMGVSLVLAAVVVGLMLFFWYPQPFFLAAGGVTLLVLLVGVDVILGPLMTFIVYDPRKEGLKYDLFVIAVLQVAALAYGGWIMFDARPVYVAFAGDRFELVEANAIEPSDHAKASAAFREMPLSGPMVVGTRLPMNEADRNVLRGAAMVGGSIGVFPQYYVPYAVIAADVPSKARPLSSLRSKHPEAAPAIDSIIATTGKPENKLRYLPLQARHGDMVVALDASNGAVVGVIPVDPW